MNSFVETLKQLGPARLGIMGAILLGLLLFFVFISLRMSTPEMQLLYTDLSTNDASAIAAALEGEEIRFEVNPDGSRVTVSEDDVGRARMILAAQGLPNGGNMGYEIFDEQSGFGTTNFVQNLNQVRALEGELARTISSLESIRSARVHLVLPQRELFSRENRPSSASVFVTVRPGSTLERQEIASVQSLVSSAVPDLKTSDVSIVDSDGNLLARGGDEDTDLMSLKAEEMRRAYESRLTDKLEDQLGRIVGFGNVRATVNAELNFDRISTNEELFDPATQVVRSSQVTEESSLEREPLADEVGVENNLPGVGGDLLADGQPTAESNRLEEVTNFEISKTVRNTIREAGEVTRLSVAVLVDGKYVDQPILDEDGEPTDETEDVYVARTEQEMEQIRRLVQSSVGFDEERGDIIEVVNLQFADIITTEDIEDGNMMFGFEKDRLLDVAEFLIVGIMIILVALLVLQPMVNRLIESGEPEIDESLEADLLAARPATPALAGPTDEDFDVEAGESADDSLVSIKGVDGKVKASTVRKVEEIIENYPDETVSVLRSWMTQDT